MKRPGVSFIASLPLGGCSGTPSTGVFGVPHVRVSFCSTGQALRRSWDTLAANASIGSMGVRHAMRLGVATMAAFLVVRMLHLPFGYWATMATLLILRPSIATTWPRGVKRAAGSTAGAALAVVIGFLVHTPLAISLVVFPLVCVTMALRRVSYSLYVIFLTPTFVLVADLATPADEFAYAMARLGNNVLGCVIALLAAYLLWPTRRAGNSAGADAGAEPAETNEPARGKIRGDAPTPYGSAPGADARDGMQKRLRVLERLGAEQDDAGTGANVSPRSCTQPRLRIVTGGAARGTAEARRGHPETRFRLKAAGRVRSLPASPRRTDAAAQTLCGPCGCAAGP
jgi:hypothetical protein